MLHQQLKIDVSAKPSQIRIRILNLRRGSSSEAASQNSLGEALGTRQHNELALKACKNSGSGSIWHFSAATANIEPRFQRRSVLIVHLGLRPGLRPRL